MLSARELKEEIERAAEQVSREYRERQPKEQSHMLKELLKKVEIEE